MQSVCSGPLWRARSLMQEAPSDFLRLIARWSVPFLAHIRRGALRARAPHSSVQAISINRSRNLVGHCLVDVGVQDTSER